LFIKLDSSLIYSLLESISKVEMMAIQSSFFNRSRFLLYPYNQLEVCCRFPDESLSTSLTT